MPSARIFQQGTSATQSGQARRNSWILEREPELARRADPLMGWVGGGDTDTQVRLSFPTLDAARAYAERQGLTVDVVPAPPVRLILQSYAENFR
jgi:hypothetical protein